MTTMFGSYQLIRKIAQGGMAEVFLAERQGEIGGFSKQVAIKRIYEHLAEDPELITMFFDEARIAAQLNHPSIVQIYDLGEIENFFYIAMEFVHGKDLRSLCERGLQVNNFIPLPLAVKVVAEAAAGLHYAHTRGDSSGQPLNIVHRDVSPQNVLIAMNGSVKVCDFGIAKAEERLTHTKTGQFKGKFAYMSPEQVIGDGRKLDQRSDIFSLGIVLYEITVCTRLFRGKNDYDTIRMVAEAEVTPPTAVRRGFPAELERIIMKALAPEAKDRYQSAEQMQIDLEEWLVEQRAKTSPVHLARYMAEIFPELLETPGGIANDATVQRDVVELARGAQQLIQQSHGMASPGVQPVTDVSTAPATPSNVSSLVVEQTQQISEDFDVDATGELDAAKLRAELAGDSFSPSYIPAPVSQPGVFNEVSSNHGASEPVDEEVDATTSVYSGSGSWPQARSNVSQPQQISATWSAGQAAPDSGHNPLGHRPQQISGQWSSGSAEPAQPAGAFTGALEGHWSSPRAIEQRQQWAEQEAQAVHEPAAAPSWTPPEPSQPAYEPAPAPYQAPAPQPAYEQPVYQQPAQQQPAYQQPAYQQPTYQQPAPAQHTPQPVAPRQPGRPQFNTHQPPPRAHRPHNATQPPVAQPAPQPAPAPEPTAPEPLWDPGSNGQSMQYDIAAIKSGHRRKQIAYIVLGLVVVGCIAAVFVVFGTERDIEPIDDGKPKLTDEQLAVKARDPIARASVNLATEPAGAHVVVNGILLPGTTPGGFELAASETNEISFFLDGYKTKTVVVRGGAGPDGAVSLEEIGKIPDEFKSSIEVETQPLGAMVFHNGEQRGPSPVVLEGVDSRMEHHIFVKAPEHHSFQALVSPVKGSKDRVNALLTPTSTKSAETLVDVNLESVPKGAYAAVDGASRVTPSTQKIDRNVLVEVKYSAPGYREQTRYLETRDAGTILLRPRLDSIKKEKGKVSISVPSSTAQIYIGANSYGDKAIKKLELSEGKNTIVLENNSGKRFEATFEVTPNKHTRFKAQIVNDKLKIVPK